VADGGTRAALGERLRAYRKAARLTGETLAARTGHSQSWVSKIEAGTRRIAVADVRIWLEQTGAPADAYATLLEMAEAAALETVDWRELHGQGWETHQRAYGELEGAAHTIRLYQDWCIPGLLQTAAYASHLLRTVLGVPEEQIAFGVTERLHRQEVLYQPDTKIDVVITEQVLRRRVGGPAVMAEQLDRLASLARLPSVDLALLPMDHDMPSAYTTNYDLFEALDEGESIVIVELKTRELRETDPEVITQYQRQHPLLRAKAIAGREAVQRVEELAQQYVEQAFGR
jgi:transcriptional regulator with XRE-family HTH domain